jgi:chromate transporter
MHRDLVERRQWISEADYKEGLTLAQLMPGPLAAQLAIYLGYVHYRVIGATVVGVAFVLPSFLMVLALGWAYKLNEGLSWMQAVFYGVGSCVIGIIGHSAYKLTTKTIGRDRLLWAIFLASVGITIWTEREMISLFLGAGLLVWLVRTRPSINGTKGTAALAGFPLGFAIPGAPRVVLHEGSTVAPIWLLSNPDQRFRVGLRARTASRSSWRSDASLTHCIWLRRQPDWQEG